MLLFLAIIILCSIITGKSINNNQPMLVANLFLS